MGGPGGYSGFQVMGMPGRRIFLDSGILLGRKINKINSIGQVLFWGGLI